ncbi:MAG: class I SAM-dependent methyltransferase [Coriobacteriia bacterium]|nr:class I SAM-dependent methyltransferase [Coriobacteriia bacterium]
MSPLPYGVKRFAAQAKKDGLRAAASRKARVLRDRPLHALRNQLDQIHDRRVTGMSLEHFEAALDDGAYDSISTPYGTLQRVLGREKFTKSDVLLDVGCGAGRPLAYLAGRRFPGQLVGIELNPSVAQVAQQWASRKKNVRIVAGDAFEHDLTPYTVFFIWKAMMPELFRQFVLKVEAEVRHPVRFFYVGDQDDGDFMDGRPGWTLRRRDWVSRIHGVPMHSEPARFSSWVFDPAAARAVAATAAESAEPAASVDPAEPVQPADPTE